MTAADDDDSWKNSMQKASGILVLMGCVWLGLYMFAEVTGCTMPTKRHQSISRSSEPEKFRSDQEFSLILGLGACGVGGLVYLVSLLMKDSPP